MFIDKNNFEYMIYKPNFLFVCARNKKRSRTAEFIFKNDNRFNIRSAGLSSNSIRKISDKDLLWADHIFVMEKNHKSKIQNQFSYIESAPFEILYIDDIYEYLDNDLIDLLTEKLNYFWETNYNIIKY